MRFNVGDEVDTTMGEARIIEANPAYGYRIMLAYSRGVYWINEWEAVRLHYLPVEGRS